MATDTTHRFVLYDSTTVDGTWHPLWDQYVRFTVNPIEYDNFSIANINQVDTLYETHGTLVEWLYFDHEPREMRWHKMAKFKYFDMPGGLIMEGSSYPQFYELKSREYHMSGKYYFLDDRGYSRVVNTDNFYRPYQVYLCIRIDKLSVDGFETAPAPYFNQVILKFTPIATHIGPRRDIE